MAGEEVTPSASIPSPVSNSQIGLPILTFEVWLMPWGGAAPDQRHDRNHQKSYFHIWNGECLSLNPQASGNG